MLRFAADENLNSRILRGLRRRDSTIDFVRIQDTEVNGADDPTVLAWAAENELVLISHDIATLVGFALRRVRNREPMTGVVAVPTHLPIGLVIEQLLIVAQAASPEDLREQVLFLPL